MRLHNLLLSEYPSVAIVCGRVHSSYGNYVINAHDTNAPERLSRVLNIVIAPRFLTLSIVLLCKKLSIVISLRALRNASGFVQPLFWLSRVEAVAPVPLSEILIAKARDVAIAARAARRPVSRSARRRAEVTVNGASVALERGRRAPKVKVLTVRNYWTSTCHPPIFGLHQFGGYLRRDAFRPAPDFRIL